jgi:hypothetical protein
LPIFYNGIGRLVFFFFFNGIGRPIFIRKSDVCCKSLVVYLTCDMCCKLARDSYFWGKLFFTFFVFAVGQNRIGWRISLYVRTAHGRLSKKKAITLSCVPPPRTRMFRGRRGNGDLHPACWGGISNARRGPLYKENCSLLCSFQYSVFTVQSPPLHSKISIGIMRSIFYDCSFILFVCKF